TDIKEMDIIKAKTDKAEHEKGKSAQELGIIMLWSTKVNPG
ncbi:hypothetical protein Tco_0765386, partial [Tanacetum coccineum]